MELYYILYNLSGRSQKYLLVLPLGSRNDKLCMIDTSGLTKSEVAKIRSGIRDIDKLSLEDRIDWIRRTIPQGYKNTYKEIYHKNYQFISSHGIN